MFLLAKLLWFLYYSRVTLCFDINIRIRRNGGGRSDSELLKIYYKDSGYTTSNNLLNEKEYGSGPLYIRPIYMNGVVEENPYSHAKFERLKKVIYLPAMKNGWAQKHYKFNHNNNGLIPLGIRRIGNGARRNNIFKSKIIINHMPLIIRRYKQVENTNIEIYKNDEPFVGSGRETSEHDVKVDSSESRNETILNDFSKNRKVVPAKRRMENDKRDKEPFTDRKSLFEEFESTHAEMEKKFFMNSMQKLNNGSSDRKLGVSFVISSFWLHSLLTLISTDSAQDYKTVEQIDNCTRFKRSVHEKEEALREFVSLLPKSNSKLRFRWSSRLILGADMDIEIGHAFKKRADDTIKMVIANASTDNITQLATTLNHMVEIDSGGALQQTFEINEVANVSNTILVNTLYFRCDWRVPVTLLNGTHSFKDTPPYREVQLFSVNDMIDYAALPEWDAEVYDIPYDAEGLSLMIIVPKNGSNLLSMVENAVTAQPIQYVRNRLQKKRIQLSLPLYTLRMTLLLPNKLEAMGITRLISAMRDGPLRLSHAVQRLMFWSETGRNAYKDDGEYLLNKFV